MASVTVCMEQQHCQEVICNIVVQTANSETGGVWPGDLATEYIVLGRSTCQLKLSGPGHLHEGYQDHLGASEPHWLYTLTFLVHLGTFLVHLGYKTSVA
jgi:hypothetical protein